MLTPRLSALPQYGRHVSCSVSHSRAFSSSNTHRSYDDTVKNLKIGSHTRVIFQGFTGKQATSNAKDSIAWGTNIVGGVTPGKEGEHLGLPVFPSVRKAQESLKPDATGIYVPASGTSAAIVEAIEAEIPLIVAVAEHIPLHDILRIHSILKTQSASRLVGANAPGIISAIGHCRIGFQPLPTFSPGHIGIVAKSGTLSYETVASLTRAGLGQSLCIGMGGDVVAGTNFVDALRVFEHDDDTEGIIIVGEVGGIAEEEAAEWIKEYKKRTPNAKPIAAVVGGVYAKPGRIMGHAGAWAAPGEGTAETKYKVLQDAGVAMVNHPAKFGNIMKKLLEQHGRSTPGTISSTTSQKRGYHTSRRLTRPSIHTTPALAPHAQNKHRSLHISASQAATLLAEKGINITTSPDNTSEGRLLVVTVDRSARSPCIIASPTTNPSQIYHRSRRFPFDYREGLTEHVIKKAVEALQLDAAPPQAYASTTKLIQVLSDLFQSTEAIALEVKIGISAEKDELQVFDPSFSFDDAAFKSNKRQPEIHALRDTNLEDPVELSAEKDGIVYIKLDQPGANIGTLVNGAGLAMNTVDALADHGGKTANFLDTGGKATSETVKRSFELILSDTRVKVIFVNIFGGLTLCDMIANGVILAFKELDMQVPVVVRLRGTNEELGQKIIAESGLSLHAFDDFEEAAEKVIELAAKS